MATSTSTTTTTTTTRRRHAFTDRERAALRRRHAAHPTQTQRELATWFEAAFGKPIKQVSVSEVLSPRYGHLDGFPAGAEPSALRKKRRRPQFEELEDALARWYAREKERGVAAITGDMVKGQARAFWHRLPCYRGVAEPSFSDGWLSGFKARQGISQRRQRRGKAGAG